jgi:ATP-dependent exoDNAse (exonuclease V) beta subunit
VGQFWRDLIAALPDASDACVRVVDAATLPVPEPAPPGPDLRALAAAEGADPLAARWQAERRERIEAAAYRPFRPIRATELAARTAPAGATTPGAGGGRDFGTLVHRLLEWVPWDAEPERLLAMARGLAPSFGLDGDVAQRAAQQAHRALGLPVMARARRAPRAFRELPVVFPEGGELVEGVVDLVFEEDGGWVVVDYKTDGIVEAQALAQAAHHAPQLQLYGRGLAQASGQPVRERVVLFTATGQAVTV